MSYAICSVPYRFSSVYPYCTGTHEAVAEITTATTGHLFLCDSQTKTGDWIQCHEPASRDLATLQETNKVLNVSDITINGMYVQTSGAIETQTESSLYTALTGTTEPPTTTEYTLNTELMDVMFTGAFWFFAFGIFFGSIMGMMRKASHK